MNCVGADDEIRLDAWALAEKFDLRSSLIGKRRTEARLSASYVELEGHPEALLIGSVTRFLLPT